MSRKEWVLSVYCESTKWTSFHLWPFYVCLLWKMVHFEREEKKSWFERPLFNLPAHDYVSTLEFIHTYVLPSSIIIFWSKHFYDILNCNRFKHLKELPSSFTHEFGFCLKKISLYRLKKQMKNKMKWKYLPFIFAKWMGFLYSVLIVVHTQNECDFLFCCFRTVFYPSLFSCFVSCGN